MFDSRILDDLAERLSDIIPQSVRDQKDEVQRKVREILLATFSKFDLVTREEFDAQVKVLARTRKKLDALEKQIAELESHGKHQTTKVKKEPEDKL